MDAAKPESRFTHRNGLSIGVPPDWLATETSRGFLLRPWNAGAMRSPPEIEIGLVSEMRPATGVHSRMIDGEPVQYRTERKEGGSGGGITVVEAWREHDTGAVLLRYTVQTEPPASADLTLVWKLLSEARK